MKRQFEFDDMAAIEAALINLRRYNQAMYISLDEKYIDNDLIEAYFREDVDSEKKIAYEKMIGAAVIQACNDDPDIKGKYKQRVGNRMQREFMAAIQAADIDWQYYLGTYGIPGTPQAEKERERRHREVVIVRKANYLDKAKKIIRSGSMRLGVTGAMTEVIKRMTDNSKIIKWTSRAATFAYSLIPDSVKNKVKETAKTAFEKTARIIEKNVERFANTPFGKAVVDVLNRKVVPIIKKGVEILDRGYLTAKEKVKSWWKKIKAPFA